MISHIDLIKLGLYEYEYHIPHGHKTVFKFPKFHLKGRGAHLRKRSFEGALIRNDTALVHSTFFCFLLPFRFRDQIMKLVMMELGREKNSAWISWAQ